MRVTLDTNVLIASLISHGTCVEIVEHCAKNHEIVLSETILSELQRVLSRKFKYPAADAAAARALFASKCLLVDPKPLPQPVCRDRADDWILATAFSGRCAGLVTGDQDLLSLARYQGFRIVSPGDFWAFEAARKNK